MKKLINILLASMLLFTTTGCDEEDIIQKTRGEINGEKIDNLLLTGKCTNLAIVANDPSYGYLRFEIDGPYLILKGTPREYYDLNDLKHFSINGDKSVILYFTHYE